VLPAVLAVRFVLELALLAAVGWWGTQAVAGWPGVALGLGLVVLVAAIWGAVVSPRARVRAPGRIRVAVEVALFGLAGLALASVGQTWWGVALLLADVAVLVALALLGRRAGTEVSPRDVQRHLSPPR
jgi:hypothetical protein